MAEAIGLAASIIAVVQLADRIVSVCKYFIETAKDYPKDLRLIYVETGSLKVIFEGLSFLDHEDPADWTTLKALLGDDGPLERCKDALAELDQLFPPLSVSAGTKRKRGKKETWQMTLASLAWPLKATKAEKLLNDIMRYKSTISMALQGQLLNDVRNMGRQLDGITRTLTAAEKRAVVSWFRGTISRDTGPYTFHNVAQESYEDQTGDWVFETPEWKSWVDCRERALWIHGIPGAGKTVLASHVIQNIMKMCETKGKQTRAVYYYCHHTHNQDETMPFLRWLISELLQNSDKTPDIAWVAYEGHAEPDVRGLLQVLEEVLPSFERVYVGIDALDESQRRENILTLLETLTMDVRFTKIQLFATSREYPDIMRKMRIISRPLSMSNPFVESDIRRYVAAKIRESPKFQKWERELQTEVENALSLGANGMFRWAVCQLDILRRLHRVSKIREALQSLPKTLDETYERIFSCIPEEELDLVRFVLHLVCFHYSLWQGIWSLPARVILEFYSALNETDNRSGPGDFRLDLDTLKDACGCLVSFSGEYEGGIADIAHYTVLEFLESSRASAPLTTSMKMRPEDLLVISAFPFKYTAIWLQDDDKFKRDTVGPLEADATLSLGLYCFENSTYSCFRWTEVVEPSLVFKLLAIFQAHYQRFAFLRRKQRDWIDRSVLWPELVCWADCCQSSKAAMLTNLLAMERFAWAKVFVSGLDPKGLLEEVLIGRQMGTELQVKGNLVEVLCQIGTLGTRTLDFLQQELDAAGLIDYSGLLPHYMLGHHVHDRHDRKERDDRGEGCSVEQLVAHGAEPNPKGCRVMPLQIAVYSRDLKGVQSLLACGADPNNTGDSKGAADNGTNLLMPFHLHGVELSEILWSLEPMEDSTVVWYLSKEELDREAAKIGELLGLPRPEAWVTTLSSMPANATATTNTVEETACMAATGCAQPPSRYDPVRDNFL